MDELVWVEKYRPKTIEETILPARYKEMFQAFVDKKEIPNMILAGPPGLGKTTVAKALVTEVGSSFMVLNGSLEANKDTLRNEIKTFASSMSIKGGKKYVILDEADYLTHHMQPALRNFMEEFSKNCGFILTCNYKHKIIEPLHSRCSLIEFKFSKKEKNEIAKEVYSRIAFILKQENIEYDKKVIAEIVVKYFPDIRKIINELQRYSSNGVIDTGILTDFDEISIKQLIEAIKQKKFNSIRDWITDNEVDDTEVYNKLYEIAEKVLKPESIPQLVLILADYQYKSAFAVNKDINLAAALVEMSIELDWK